VGGSGDTLNRLEEIVNEERYRAAGRVRVAVDSLDIKDVNLREAEQGALADEALANFEAQQSGGTRVLPSTVGSNPRKLGS
jgi:hypothetical protein